jgi:tRNA pseudouridine13 synthase
MKLKCLPEDFRVEELPTVVPGRSGHHTFYRLTKRGIGTPEAVEAIRRRWDVSTDRVHVGGLKDRHALTIQYLTIREGPERPIYQPGFELEPIGRLPFPYGPQGFKGNRFAIVMRDLGPQSAVRADSEAQMLARDGVPNYFDDQRFGSVGASGELIGSAWLRGDYDRALWLAIAEPNQSDRPDTRREKDILRETWGNWVEAKARLDRSHARSLVTYLVDHPEDFRGAYARLRQDMRRLHFSAFQSHLWNLMLGRRLEQVARPEQLAPTEFKTATLPIHRKLEPEQMAALTAWDIPLPASRSPLPDGEPRALAESVLGPLGLAWDQLRVKHLKDVFLSKGTRANLIVPIDLKTLNQPDGLYPGKRALTVAFDLPRGAYATLLVKRLDP